MRRVISTMLITMILVTGLNVSLVFAENTGLGDKYIIDVGRRSYGDKEMKPANIFDSLFGYAHFATNGKEHIATGNFIKKGKDSMSGDVYKGSNVNNFDIDGTVYELCLNYSKDGINYERMSGKSEFGEDGGIWLQTWWQEYKLFWDGEKYIIISKYPYAFCSIDGKTFVKKQQSFNDPYGLKPKAISHAQSNTYNVIFDGEAFFSKVDGSVSVMRSDDGISWDYVWVGKDPTKVIFDMWQGADGNIYAMLDNTLFFSRDGINWAKRNSKLAIEIMESNDDLYELYGSQSEYCKLNTLCSNEYNVFQVEEQNRIYISRDMDNYYCVEFGKEIGKILLVKDNLLITENVAIDIKQLISELNNNAAHGFSDIKETDRFHEDVIALAKTGIISKSADSKFRPDDYMTTDHFIKSMITVLGYDIKNGQSYWAQPFIDKARELGLIDGNEYKTKEELQANITRAQLAKICEKTLNVLNGNKAYIRLEEIQSYVLDNREVKLSGLSEYVYHMWEAGVITGYSDGRFKPNDLLTRSQTATVIRRIIDQKERKPYESLAPVSELTSEIIERVQSYPYAYGINPEYDFKYMKISMEGRDIMDYFLNNIASFKANETFFTNRYLTYKTENITTIRDGYPTGFPHYVVRGVLQTKNDDSTITEQDIEYEYRKYGVYNKKIGDYEDKIEILIMRELSDKKFIRLNILSTPIKTPNTELTVVPVEEASDEKAAGKYDLGYMLNKIGTSKDSIIEEYGEPNEIIGDNNERIHLMRYYNEEVDFCYLNKEENRPICAIVVRDSSIIINNVHVGMGLADIKDILGTPDVIGSFGSKKCIEYNIDNGVKSMMIFCDDTEENQVVSNIVLRTPHDYNSGKMDIAYDLMDLLNN